MPTPLARRNLLHNKMRTTVAAAGVAFAVVLIFMQLGFLGAVADTAVLIYNALRFDICIRSREYLHLSDARTFPVGRLNQAATVQGVAGTTPFYISLNQWRIPRMGEQRGILVMGVDPADPALTTPSILENLPRLSTPDRLLIDTRTRHEFGPIEGRKFSASDIGQRTEIADRAVTIAGTFTLGTGLAANGAVVLTSRGYSRVTPGQPLDRLNLGLIHLAPGADVEEVAARLRSALPPDVAVLTRQEALDWEYDRWIWKTSFGLIFQLGAAVALIVGTAIVYQVLSSDIANLIGEYATLKAMGYRNRFLIGVVLQQAVYLAILGYVPGLILSELLYRTTSFLAGVTIRMTVFNITLVLVLALTMCIFSGLAAVRTVLAADPADLY